MKPDFLQRVLNGAEVHHETQGTRIEYDTASFYLTAEVPDGDNTEFQYRAYNMDSDEVKLSDNEMTIVSTKLLDVGEMHFYSNRIECFCMNRGYFITIPDDSEYKQLLDKQDE